MRTEISRKKVLLTDLGLIYAAAIWGSTFIMVKETIANVDPTMLVCYRFSLAGALTWLYLFFAKRPRSCFSIEGFILAVLVCGIYVPQTIGLAYTPAANSGFITGMFIVFVPFFGHFFFSLKINRRDYLAVALSVVGLFLLTGGLKDINSGDELTLITAATYALHVLFSDRFLRAGSDSILLSMQQFVLTGIICFGLGLVLHSPLGVQSAGATWAIIFLALFPTVSATLIQFYAQRHTSPLKVSLIFCLEPVFAAAFAWTLGGEHPTWYSIAGGALMVCGMLIPALPANFFVSLRAES